MWAASGSPCMKVGAVISASFLSRRRAQTWREALWASRGAALGWPVPAAAGFRPGRGHGAVDSCSELGGRGTGLSPGRVDRWRLQGTREAEAGEGSDQALCGRLAGRVHAGGTPAGGGGPSALLEDGFQNHLQQEEKTRPWHRRGPRRLSGGM